RFHRQSEKAIPLLEQVLPVFSKLPQPDPTGRRDTLRELAGHLVAAKRFTAAGRRLREALDLHQEHAAGDRLTYADLLGGRADLAARQGNRRQASRLRERAAQEYRGVLEEPRADRREVGGALRAFWGLQVLYQRASQLERALTLTRSEGEQ